MGETLRTSPLRKLRFFAALLCGPLASAQFHAYVAAYSDEYVTLPSTLATFDPAAGTSGSFTSIPAGAESARASPSMPEIWYDAQVFQVGGDVKTSLYVVETATQRLAATTAVPEEGIAPTVARKPLSAPTVGKAALTSTPESISVSLFRALAAPF